MRPVDSSQFDAQEIIDLASVALEQLRAIKQVLSILWKVFSEAEMSLQETRVSKCKHDNLIQVLDLNAFTHGGKSFPYLEKLGENLTFFEQAILNLIDEINEKLENYLPRKTSLDFSS